MQPSYIKKPSLHEAGRGGDLVEGWGDLVEGGGVFIGGRGDPGEAGGRSARGVG